MVFNMVGGAGGGIKLESIAITTPPDNITYLPGEVFDPAGTVVTASYSNGATLTATGWTYSPSPEPHPDGIRCRQDGPIRRHVRHECWELYSGGHPNRAVQVGGRGHGGEGYPVVYC